MIGTTSVIKNQVSGTLGPTKRTLKLGDHVFQNELIATGQVSSAQILFADETALNIGPNSQVSLDKFVYNPASKKGQLAIRAVTGAFRFVSGSAPKESYKIDTPVGSIGIRGTTLEFVIRGNTLMLSLTEGATTLCTHSGRCVHLTVPGTYVIATGQQLGETKSKYGRDCGAGGVQCAFGDGSDTVYLDYLGLFRFQGDVGSPTFQPPSPPPTGGPPPGGRRLQVRRPPRGSRRSRTRALGFRRASTTSLPLKVTVSAAAGGDGANSAASVIDRLWRLSIAPAIRGDGDRDGRRSYHTTQRCCIHTRWRAQPRS